VLLYYVKELFQDPIEELKAFKQVAFSDACSALTLSLRGRSRLACVSHQQSDLLVCKLSILVCKKGDKLIQNSYLQVEA